MLIAVCLHCVHGTELEQSQDDSASTASAGTPDMSSTDTGALFLTPLIDNCSYYEARERSKAPYFQMMANVTAHSGYITVNKTAGSNLFFLLTEVEGNSSDAPLLLWTQGGPGLSALFGQFLENGPLAFGLHQNGSPHIYPRTNTLQKNMSVLYLDLPVGAGFSFTTDVTHGYPTKLEDIVQHVLEFLKQFLEVFSEYKERDFYLAGESYGARYSVAVAEYLLKNPNNVSLHLQGIIGGNGFIGPVLYTADSSEFLYRTSMLTEEGYKTFAGHFEAMRNLLASHNYTMALGMLLTTIFADSTKVRPTLFQNLTLYNDHASPLYTERPLFMVACFLFLNGSTDIRKAIHVGENATFQYINEALLLTFASDWLRDISPLTERVLNESRVLFYTGQLDALFPSVNQRAYFATLNWTNAQAYRKASRCTWKPYLQYYGNAGYVKKAVNFTEAVLLGMSHYGAVEKPDEVYYLMLQFVFRNSPNTQDVLAQCDPEQVNA